MKKPEQTPLNLFDEEEQSPAPLRDETWLQARLDALCKEHFSDLPAGFPIRIVFGAPSLHVLGSIRPRNGESLIRLSGLYRWIEVPEWVADATIVHELAHYVHGIGSGLERLYPHAHRGGVVDAELERRGLGEMSRKAKQWRSQHWMALYERFYGPSKIEEKGSSDPYNYWFSLPICQNRRTLEEINQISVYIAQRAELTRPPFKCTWLAAKETHRHRCYYFSEVRELRIHPLISSLKVPVSVLWHDIAYWLCWEMGIRKTADRYRKIQLLIGERRTRAALKWIGGPGRHWLERTLKWYLA